MTTPDPESPEAPAPVPEAKGPDDPKRRTFLALTVIGGTVAAAAGGVTWWVVGRGELEELEPPEPMSDTGEVLAAAIRDKLDMLVIPDATLAKWVNRYEEHARPWKPGRKVKRKLLQNFLLSTDFFPGADESKPLRYVTYYDPYISVCYNPLRHAE